MPEKPESSDAASTEAADPAPAAAKPSRLSSARDSVSAGLGVFRRRLPRLALFAGAVVLAAAAVLGGGVALGWRIATDVVLAGTPNPQPTVIEVPVSSGDTGIQMPDVRGLTPDDALQVLADAGIAVELVESTTRPAAGESGVVIEQVPAFGSASPSPVELVISGPAAVPAIVGIDVDEAISQLRELGAQIVRVGVYDPDAVVDIVTVVEPAAGSPLPESVTITVTEAASAIHFANLDSDGDCGADDEITMDGRIWKPAVVCSSSTSGRTGRWSLGNAVDEVIGRVGIPDDEGPGASATVAILADGVALGTYTVVYGETQAFNFRTTGVIELTVVVTSVGDTRPQIAFGDFVAQGSSAAIAGLTRR
jgi:hypothetical protein